MNQNEVIKTINVLALVALIAFVLSKAFWLVLTALILLLLGLFKNPIATIIATYWMKFAMFIGNINSKIILTLVFYVILTPLAFLFRYFNKEIVNHFKNKKQDSYFEDLNITYNKEVFERVW